MITFKSPWLCPEYLSHWICFTGKCILSYDSLIWMAFIFIMEQHNFRTQLQVSMNKGCCLNNVLSHGLPWHSPHYYNTVSFLPDKKRTISPSDPRRTEIHVFQCLFLRDSNISLCKPKVWWLLGKFRSQVRSLMSLQDTKRGCVGVHCGSNCGSTSYWSSAKEWCWVSWLHFSLVILHHLRSTFLEALVLKIFHHIKQALKLMANLGIVPHVQILQ